MVEYGGMGDRCCARGWDWGEWRSQLGDGGWEEFYLSVMYGAVLAFHRLTIQYPVAVGGVGRGSIASR
jgi:hypothetical protein